MSRRSIPNILVTSGFPSTIGSISANLRVSDGFILRGLTFFQFTERVGLYTWSILITLGHDTIYSFLAESGSISVLGGGGGGNTSSPPSCGRNVNGTPNMFTYSGSNIPFSFSSYEVLLRPL